MFAGPFGQLLLVAEQSSLLTRIAALEWLFHEDRHMTKHAKKVELDFIAEAFKRDIPGAIVRFFDTGHFALLRPSMLILR